VAVNCAAIPPGLAERLLFGARRGAFSGAVADAEGYLQAAHKGTLFLDEVGDLDLAVQAKLLRVLETKEVLPLGASRASAVDIRVCSATLCNLRERVTNGEFRQDLYYRIGRPEVEVPPLRDRREEIPWLIAHEIARVQPGLTASIGLLETCMTRAWPGNIRELVSEIRTASRAALDEGEEMVCSDHLSETAGERLEQAPPPPDSPALARKLRIEEALRREEGNVTRAAQSLGMHRTQLRRWLARYGIEARDFRPEGGMDLDEIEGEPPAGGRK
jgi:transcriptional regulator with PAS, ATPase and Fis domain